jgi:hypothetical protein
MSKCYFCGDIKAGCPECHAQARQAGASSFERDTVKPAYVAGDAALDKAEKPKAMSWEAAVAWAQRVAEDFTTYVNPDHAMKAPTISEMEESIARIEALFPKPPKNEVHWKACHKSPAFDCLELGRPDPLDEIAHRVGQWQAAKREHLFACFLRTLPGIFSNNDDSTAGQLLGGVLDDNTED